MKSAQLTFDKCHNTWRVVFRCVKFARDGCRDLQPFDDLYLVIFAPSGLHILLHDQETGVARAGVATKACGHNILVRGSCGETWAEALPTILQKMQHRGCCEIVARLSAADPLTQALYTRLRQESVSACEETYRHIPMSLMNPSIRGQRVQQVGMEIDRIQNPTAFFSQPHDEKTITGARRGKANASVDWRRDDVRVEVKHGKVALQSRDGWQAQFSNIKTDSPDFDELWLALYSPCGLYFLKHPPCYTSLASTGVLTKMAGKKLIIYGGRGLDVQDAVHNIKMKLQAHGCELHATVAWH